MQYTAMSGMKNCDIFFFISAHNIEYQFNLSESVLYTKGFAILATLQILIGRLTKLLVQEQAIN